MLPKRSTPQKRILWRVTLSNPPRKPKVTRDHLHGLILNGCCDGRLRRQFSHFRQNRKENQVPGLAAVVSERVLIEIALQVFLAHRVVDTAKTSFHQTPESLDSLSVNLSPRSGDVNLLTVPDAVVPITPSFDPVISRVIISKHATAGKHKFMDKSMQSGLLGVCGDTRYDAATLALHHSYHGSLGLLNRVSSLGASAHIHFVNFHRRSLQSDVLRHQGSNLTEDAPRGFVGNTSLTLNLFRGDAAPGGTHQEHGLKPDAERGAGLFKNSSGQGVQMVTAMVTRIRGAASNAVVLANRASTVLGITLRHAIREAHIHYALEAGVIVRELSVKLVSGVSKLGWDCLSAIHGRDSMPFVLLVVKG